MIDKDEPKIPTRADWEWPDGHHRLERLDDYEFYRTKFLGKGVEEMISYLEDNPTETALALYCFPTIPFQYYVAAYRILLLGRDTPCDAFDGYQLCLVADSFFSLLKAKLQETPEVILPIMDDLLSLAEYVADRQDFFDADADIFGSFRDRYFEIKGLYEEQRVRFEKR